MRQKQELAACRGRTKLEEAGACSYLPSEINTTTHINMSSEKKGWGAGIVGVQKVTKHLMNFFTFTYHPLSFTKNIDIVSVSLMTSTYSRRRLLFNFDRHEKEMTTIYILFAERNRFLRQVTIICDTISLARARKKLQVVLTQVAVAARSPSA